MAVITVTVIVRTCIRIQERGVQRWIKGVWRSKIREPGSSLTSGTCCRSAGQRARPTGAGPPAPEPGGSACCYWNGYGSSATTRLKGLPAADQVDKALVLHPAPVSDRVPARLRHPEVPATAHREGRLFSMLPRHIRRSLIPAHLFTCCAMAAPVLAAAAAHLSERKPPASTPKQISLTPCS